MFSKYVFPYTSLDLSQLIEMAITSFRIDNSFLLILFDNINKHSATIEHFEINLISILDSNIFHV